MLDVRNLRQSHWRQINQLNKDRNWRIAQNVISGSIIQQLKSSHI